MIPSLNPRAQIFLNGLNRVSERMGDAQKRITTGKKVSGVSDEPDHVGSLLTAHQHLETAKQIANNLSRVKAEVDGAESALQTGTQFLERIRTLGAQGATFSQTAQTRAALADEVGSLLEQMVGLSSTQIEGRYIFSGDADDQAPYTIDLNQATPLSTYQGATATRQVQHPNGTTFTIGHTAQDIFDNADSTQNVFAAVDTLRQALLVNDQTAVEAALDGITGASTHLASELAYYGTTQNKIAEAQDFSEQLQVTLQTQIAGFEDADLTEAILELQQGQTQQQAALGAWSQIPRSTLFDFIG